MTIREALFVISSAIVFPAVTVLTISFFTGGLRRTEDARYLPVLENDVDWWGSPDVQEGGHAS